MRRHRDHGQQTPASTQIGVTASPTRPASAAVIGAKTVLANPAAKVSTVNALDPRCPYHRVSAANAGA